MNKTRHAKIRKQHRAIKDEKIKNLKNAYAVITVKGKRVNKKDADVITVGHRYK